MSAQPQRRRNNFRRFVTETAWTLASSAFLAMAGFLLNIMLGNALGEAGLGVYTLTATVYMLLTTLAVVGLPIALVKYTAEFIDQPETGAQFYTASLLIVATATIIASFLLYAARYVIAAIFKMPELLDLLPILGWGIPFYGLNKVAIARLNGLRQMERMAVSEILRYLLMIVLTGVGVGWLKGGLIAAVWALSLTELFLFPILWVLTRLHRNLNIANLVQRCQTLGKVGGQLVLARIIADLDARLSILLPAIFLTKSEVGIYALAALMADSLNILPTALEKVTGPVMAELYARNQGVPLESLINQTMRLATFLLTLSGGVLVLFFPQIVGLLYPGHPGFLMAKTPLMILVWGSVFQGISISVGMIFVGVNRSDVLFRINLERVVINLCVTLLLVNALRVNGVALSKALTAFLIFALRTRTMASVAGTRVDYRPLLLIPAMGAAIMLALQLLPDISAWIYVAQIVLWATFALTMTRLWHFDHYLVRLRRLLMSIREPKAQLGL